MSRSSISIQIIRDMTLQHAAVKDGISKRSADMSPQSLTKQHRREYDNRDCSDSMSSAKSDTIGKGLLSGEISRVGERDEGETVGCIHP